MKILSLLAVLMVSVYAHSSPGPVRSFWKRLCSASLVAWDPWDDLDILFKLYEDDGQDELIRQIKRRYLEMGANLAWGKSENRPSFKMLGDTLRYFNRSEPDPEITDLLERYQAFER